jgi:hypothetical protein
LTDEEIFKIADILLARSITRSRDEFLIRERNFSYSNRWWDYIPEDEDKKRHHITGLYLTPVPGSKVSICDDYLTVQPWMRKKGVFRVVRGVMEPPTFTPIINKPNFDEKKKLLNKKVIDTDGNEVRMPGIPFVQVSFPQDDYEDTYLIPANCLKEVGK